MKYNIFCIHYSNLVDFIKEMVYYFMLLCFILAFFISCKSMHCVYEGRKKCSARCMLPVVSPETIILLYYWFQVFEGNFDQHTYKINKFSQPITARYVRLVVLTWHSYITLRMEYLIC